MPIRNASPSPRSSRITRAPWRSSTPARAAAPISASSTVWASSVTGKTLPVSSSLSATPRDANHSSVASTGKARSTRATNGRDPPSKSRSLTSRWVTLQRVPPDMRILSPTLGWALSSVTRAPPSAARSAAVSPAAPAPTTAT